MLRPRPKRPREKPQDINDGVWRFFTQEWKNLDAELSRCSRIEGLSGEIKMISEPFDNGCRKEYFQSVAEALGTRPRHERYLVLVDPDTGIVGSKPSAKHVCLQDLEIVWKAMRHGDVLLVYQHNAHVEKLRWISDKKQILAGATGLPNELIRDYPHSDVCYFVLEK